MSNITDNNTNTTCICISHETHDEERALYGLVHACVNDVTFAGPADGESSLKECRDICVVDSSFSLRYPLWHTTGFSLQNVTMDELTRAAIWYARHGRISNSTLGGIKAVRECSDISIDKSTIDSPEFGWMCHDLRLSNTTLTSEYPFFHSTGVSLDNVTMTGKYSFQYVDGLTIEDSVLDTKDAFWHARNVTVRNSVIKGEYLGWYSDGLTLVNCRIEGTQPLCYAKNLTLIDCEMVGCDLAFEYSDVNATISGHVDSIKNPRSGMIFVDSVGEVVRDGSVYDCTGEVLVR
ncbi:MAG: DUF3737 family protein [Atopobiaceae bacterium]|jgi:hypothetical protein|nr:DUF3737 family protein [Atopobiaceae bacterium]